MQQESRVGKSLLNARINLIFYALALALAFFSRRIFLNLLGADFIGLTGTLQNLLGFLNLAELGVGSAIGYTLYKPLLDQDKSQICEIISVLGYLYRWIGRIILAGGILLGAFLPLIYPDTTFSNQILFFAYGAFLASALLGYFINYRQTLLAADQKNYVITTCYQSVIIVKTLIQMGAAYYTGSYYLWIGIELVFGIIYSLLLNRQIDRCYPWLHTEIRQGRTLLKKYPEILRYVRQLFAHKIGGLVQFQTTPFLIYSFVSLQTVAYYGNYTIVTDKLNILIDRILEGTSAGIGNLIAERNQIRSLRVFWEIIAVRIWLAGVCAFAIWHTLPSFITLWLGAEYLLPDTVVFLLALRFFLCIIRGGFEHFIHAHGLFYDTWAPLAESALFLSIAIVGGYYRGLEGVLLGSVISTAIIVFGWKSWFLFVKGFQCSAWNFWKSWSIYLVVTLASFAITSELSKILAITKTDITWIRWLYKTALLTTLFATIHFGLLWGATKGMRDLVKQLMRRIK